MNLRNIEAKLGTPFALGEDYLIYHGDCIDYMQHLPASMIDLTVTSPPYNIGKEYESKLPLSDYLLWCEKWLDELYRLTTDTGTLWLNLGYLQLPNQAKALPIPYLLWQRIRFFIIQEIVWSYGAGVAGKKFFSPRNEKFLWCVKDEQSYIFNLDDVRDPNVKYPKQKKNGKIKVNLNGKNPGDVWYFKKVTSGQDRASKERTPHPAQFPEEVIERVIRASSNPGDLILDPFLGSGTTAAVALRLNRRVLGFEIRKDYCEIARKRVEQAIYQRALPQQPELFPER